MIADALAHQVYASTAAMSHRLHWPQLQEELEDLQQSIRSHRSMRRQRGGKGRGMSSALKAMQAFAAGRSDMGSLRGTAAVGTAPLISLEDLAATVGNSGAADDDENDEGSPIDELRQLFEAMDVDGNGKWRQRTAPSMRV